MPKLVRSERLTSKGKYEESLAASKFLSAANIDLLDETTNTLGCPFLFGPLFGCYSSRSFLCIIYPLCTDIIHRIFGFINKSYCLRRLSASLTTTSLRLYLLLAWRLGDGVVFD